MALDDYWSFAIERHEFEPLRERVWQLRHQFTSFDATYLALAEALDAPLVTCDRRLATKGHRAEVRVFGTTRWRLRIAAARPLTPSTQLRGRPRASE